MILIKPWQSLVGLLDFKYQTTLNYFDLFGIFQQNLKACGVAQKLSEKLSAKLESEFKAKPRPTMTRLEYLVKLSELGIVAKRQNDTVGLKNVIDLLEAES